MSLHFFSIVGHMRSISLLLVFRLILIFVRTNVVEFFTSFFRVIIQASAPCHSFRKSASLLAEKFPFFLQSRIRKPGNPVEHLRNAGITQI